MKRDVLVVLITIIVLGVIIGIFSLIINSIKPSSGQFPDWVVKPAGNYSGLYCGTFSSNNTFLESMLCQDVEDYLLHDGYYRVKSFFGPTNIHSDIRFAVFNISYQEVKNRGMSNKDLLKLEIENPYREVYFCGFDNTPQIYWDCISKADSKEIVKKCTVPFYNLNINSYIDEKRLNSLCIRII